jgi:hypothetical protein
MCLFCHDSDDSALRKSAILETKVHQIADFFGSMHTVAHPRLIL